MYKKEHIYDEILLKDGLLKKIIEQFKELGNEFLFYKTQMNHRFKFFKFPEYFYINNHMQILKNFPVSSRGGQEL